MSGHREEQDLRAEVIQLSDLKTFFQDPVRYLLRHRYRIHLPAIEPEPDTEPYEMDGLARWKIADHFLDLLLSSDRSFDGSQQRKQEVHRIGLLPAAGDFSEQIDSCYRKACNLTEKIRKVQQQYPDIEDLECSLLLDDGTGLAGSVPAAKDDKNAVLAGPVRWRYGDIHASEQLSFWIDRLMLAAAGLQADEKAFASIYLGQKANNKNPTEITLSAHLPRKKAREYLLALTEIYRRGQVELLPFLPQSSLEYVKKQRKKTVRKTPEIPEFFHRTKWQSQRNSTWQTRTWGKNPYWRLVFECWPSPLFSGDREKTNAALRQRFVEISKEVFTPFLLQQEETAAGKKS